MKDRVTCDDIVAALAGEDDGCLSALEPLLAVLKRECTKIDTEVGMLYMCHPSKSLQPAAESLSSQCVLLAFGALLSVMPVRLRSARSR